MVLFRIGLHLYTFAPLHDGADDLRRRVWHVLSHGGRNGEHFAVGTRGRGSRASHRPSPVPGESGGRGRRARARPEGKKKRFWGGQFKVGFALVILVSILVILAFGLTASTHGLKNGSNQGNSSNAPVRSHLPSPLVWTHYLSPQTTSAAKMTLSEPDFSPSRPSSIRPRAAPTRSRPYQHR